MLTFGFMNTSKNNAYKFSVSSTKHIFETLTENCLQVKF